MLIESVFEYKAPIPQKYTCEGENISPPLHFLQINPKTKSLALIVDDPDAPHGTFDHWIVWNIVPTLQVLSEGARELKELEPAPVFGINGYKKQGYNGPCPPDQKAHRYFFKLYALDTTLNLPAGSTKKQVEEAMKDHIIEKAELIGLYQKTR